ncbi:hypothetical protein Tco_1158450 [Tanacetum coccineum]
MLLLTCHYTSTPTKDSVCDSVTPRSMPQHDSSTPADESVITYTQLSGVIDDVVSKLSFKERNWMERQVLVMLHVVVLVFHVPNDHVVNESDTHVDVEPVVDIVRIEEHVVEQVRVDEVVDGSAEEYVVHGSGEEDVAQGNGQEVVEETNDASKDDDDDVDDDDDDVLLVDEEMK